MRAPRAACGNVGRPGAAPGTVTHEMEGLREPLDATVHRQLRAAVLDHVSTEARRVHPATLHVGVPGGLTTSHTPGQEPTDHGLRTDMVAAMAHRTARSGVVPIVWLTRTGTLDLQDVDASWLAASRAAYAEAGRHLIWVVVHRHGWWDPRSGLSQRWVRLRPVRSPAVLADDPSVPP